MDAPPEIFDRKLRAIRADRGAADGPGFLRSLMAEELLDRLGDVKRNFSDALDLGPAGLASALEIRGIRTTAAGPGMLRTKLAGGTRCDEDALPFPPASFDLVVATGGLESVNDLPGALIQIRRLLRPDGLFLGAMVGAGSLPALREAMLAADLAHGDAATPRIHPQIDVPTMGNLLSRAGFALPVADGHRLELRYGSLSTLVADLRAAGATNVLRSRSTRPLSRLQAGAAHAAFAARGEPDGKTTEVLELIYLIGWAPAPSQPQPARRGSGRTSLAEALRPRGEPG